MHVCLIYHRIDISVQDYGKILDAVIAVDNWNLRDMELNCVRFVDYSSTIRQHDRWLIDTLTIHQSAFNTQRPPWKSMDKQERPGNRVMKRRNSSARNRSRPAGARFSSPLVLIWIHFFPRLIGHGWEPTRRDAARREPRKSSFDEEETPPSSFLRIRNRGTASPNLHFSTVTWSAEFLQRKWCASYTSKRE